MRIRPLAVLTALALLVPAQLFGGPAHAAAPAIAIDLDDPASSPRIDGGTQDWTTNLQYVTQLFPGDIVTQRFTSAVDGLVSEVTLPVRGMGGPATFRFDVYPAAGFVNETNGTFTHGPAVLEGSAVAVPTDTEVDLTFDEPAELALGQDYVLVVTVPEGSAEFKVDDSQAGAGQWYRRYADSTSWGTNTATRQAFRMTASTPLIRLLGNAGPSGDGGWFVGDVTSTYACHGTVACAAPTITDTDGENVVSGAFALDDVEYTWSHVVRIDTTAPVVAGELVELEEGDPWYGHRVHWTCDDATSGVPECPDDTVVTGLGDDTVASVEVADAAGNVGQGVVDDLIADPFAPAITLVAAPEDGQTYPHGTTFTPTCTAVSTVPGRAGDTVPCVVDVDDEEQADGSVDWSLTATATDSGENGGATSESVAWTVAAMIVPTTTPTATPTSSATPSPRPTVMPAQPALRAVVKGLASLPKRNGFPVLRHDREYPITVKLRRGGAPLAGRPTRLRSGRTDRAAAKGTPAAAAAKLTRAKKKNTWRGELDVPRRQRGQFRKFAIRAKDGTTVPLVVFVAR